MSIWNDIRKKSLGKEQRAEDSPIHVVKMQHSSLSREFYQVLSREFYQVKYLGRVDGHSTNQFFPQGLGELYQIQEDCTLYGIKFNVGDMLIAYADKNWDDDYYVYKRKQQLVR